jgi:acylphosphatase
VQAVGFRKATLQQALWLGLVGFVQNEIDGSVYIEAEGDSCPLDELIAWAKKGPTMAHVRFTYVKPKGAPLGETEFRVLR